MRVAGVSDTQASGDGQRYAPVHWILLFVVEQFFGEFEPKCKGTFNIREHMDFAVKELESLAGLRSLGRELLYAKPRHVGGSVSFPKSLLLAPLNYLFSPLPWSCEHANSPGLPSVWSWFWLERQERLTQVKRHESSG